ncbi:hypothetical protein C8Q79DRAFT_737364 [Trametes meyenii]|nr:hypothetical protein C8Q79DRAFT_737364 [Trametes meyenii]
MTSGRLGSWAPERRLAPAGLPDAASVASVLWAALRRRRSRGRRLKRRGGGEAERIANTKTNAKAETSTAREERGSKGARARRLGHRSTPGRDAGRRSDMSRVYVRSEDVPLRSIDQVISVHDCQASTLPEMNCAVRSEGRPQDAGLNEREGLRRDRRRPPTRIDADHQKLPRVREYANSNKHGTYLMALDSAGELQQHRQHRERRA